MKSENWKTVRLGDVCEFIGGGTPDKSNNSFWNGNIPWASVKDLKGNDLFETQDFITELGLNNSSANMCKKGDLIVATRIAPGRSTVSQIEAAINQDLKIVKSEQCNSYLRYAFNYLEPVIVRKSTGATVLGINLANLKELQIPLPPLETQKHIAAVLDKCTVLIAKHKQMLAKYDTLIKSRFIEMFGDEQVENGKWKVERLENVCTKITDGEHGSVSRTSNGFVFLNAKHIKQSGEIDWGTATYISEENHKKIYKRCNPQHNDILLTTTGTIGNVAIVPDVKEFSMDRGITLLKPQFSILNPQFIASYLRMDKMQVIMNQNVHASAIGHLFLNKVYSLQIPIPPLSLQNDFAAFVQQIDKSRFTVQKSLHKTEILYKSLMQTYFG